jgi:hypothetical protein
MSDLHHGTGQAHGWVAQKRSVEKETAARHVQTPFGSRRNAQRLWKNLSRDKSAEDQQDQGWEDKHFWKPFADAIASLRRDTTRLTT